MSNRTITVDDEFKSRANEILNRLWDNLPESDENIDCPIKECIAQVLRYDSAKTFKYILLTQLLGKAVDENVNILTFQTSSSMVNSWAARSLCEDVITKGGFEESALNNILGASKQPYNSSPGQFPDLRRSNASSTALAPIRDALVDNLPLIETSEQAEDALTCCLIELRRQIKLKSLLNPEITFESTPQNMVLAKSVLEKIAGLGGNGEGLSLATAMLLHITIGTALGFQTKLYKVTSSKRGRGDTDLFDGDVRFATFELKDKPFTAGEVMEYAKKALDENCHRFFFVYGPNSGGAPPIVFTESDEDYLVQRNMQASCVSYDSLQAALFLMVEDIDLNALNDSCDAFSLMAQIKPDVVNRAKKILRDLID